MAGKGCSHGENQKVWFGHLAGAPGCRALKSHTVVLFVEEAAPAFLKTEQVAGALGWLGYGHQAGHWSATGPETTDRFRWLTLAAPRPQTLKPLISGVYGFRYPRMHTVIQLRIYVNTHVPALSARKQNRSRHEWRCLEGQAGRVLKQDLEENQELSSRVEELCVGGRSRARCKGLKPGKDLLEEELLEKGEGRGGVGRATSGVGRS